MIKPARRATGIALTVAVSLLLPTAGLAASPVTAERIIEADQEPGNWLTHGRTYSEQRYSPLDQIHSGNVDRLRPAWSYLTGTRRGIEATPIVVDGLLVATGSWSRVYALDAATGREVWTFDPAVPGAAGRKPCCDVVNRGVAVWEDRVFVGTIDGRLIALDLRDGRVIWEVMTVDQSRSYTITGAPRVVKGQVIIGNGGAELGVRGYVSAYDAKSGELTWRFYTVPANRDGPHEHPELAFAARTWSRDALFETGLGGTVWDSMAYDPRLDLLYVGVGNSTPYNRRVRSPSGGDNLFLTCILALDPDDGRLAWHYQTTPAENWDYTATQHMILADLVIDGRKRQVLMQAPKNGFFYVLDRASGELLSADAYLPITWATHVDSTSGRPVETGADWHDAPVTVRPGPGGGHNWQPMAFHPGTGLVYIPVDQNRYTFVADRNFRFLPGWWNTGEDFPRLLQLLTDASGLVVNPPTRLVAWDPVARREAWAIDHRAFKSAGILATAGNLVFQGTGGEFVAYRADTGATVWSSAIGVGIMAPPVTYTVEGIQYIAVMAGLGGGSLAMTPVEIENEGRLVAYRLDGTAQVPPFSRVALPAPELPSRNWNAERVRRGADLYNRYCLVCHGVHAASGGVLPDLRRASAAVHRDWQAIVIGGTRQDRGMAGFADLITPDDADAIHGYVVSEARQLVAAGSEQP